MVSKYYLVCMGESGGNDPGGVIRAIRERAAGRRVDMQNLDHESARFELTMVRLVSGLMEENVEKLEHSTKEYKRFIETRAANLPPPTKTLTEFALERLRSNTHADLPPQRNQQTPAAQAQ